ncbi:tRNA (adenosine(37)-N6)-threonylcarbamoyltransferase complex dimerization subunit type 1 TsaB [Pedobacter sp. SD-b]|uniref:tRNA (Adenosine(37)-N6)-threonylcarbamoyltransferase complex dimerization subunit type 1 TsaB n=1 Tax=Pedobacter segetis TaxID=2793069 RepID=A0ABS1BG26_9SPHI|nr:tRNA (adenosine(37)-N6)-threonylcarbamoyltransferase complex dimerization subunit type 1 TsaB [Pedobacter segetis]MBK0381817.1 tRNA (adenosine(37)-N6)-threonylcarbamoyltransferase complex dimerization subunit type 1 TsaB [Pedobacter segetis]
MPLILQIETATQTCSVALAQDGKVLQSIQKTEKNIHASYLTLFIEELLKKSERNYQDLSAVAVSMGPGSYTGLRIGVSTAKGLCYALDIPLIAVNTLEAMAAGFKQKCFSVNGNSLFCPMIDARRMEVYHAVFDDRLKPIAETAAKIIDEESFNDLLRDHKVYFFGDGAAKCEELLGKNPNARVMDDYLCNADDLTFLALKKFNDHDFEDVAYFEPFYLKDFVAGKKKV